MLRMQCSGNAWMISPGNTKRGKYHCTIDLLFDWFGLVCFAKKKIVGCHTADSKPAALATNIRLGADLIKLFWTIFTYSFL